MIAEQLADVIALRDDARDRGWDDEATRDQHVADALGDHLRHLDRSPRTSP